MASYSFCLKYRFRPYKQNLARIKAGRREGEGLEELRVRGWKKGSISDHTNPMVPEGLLEVLSFPVGMGFKGPPQVFLCNEDCMSGG